MSSVTVRFGEHFRIRRSEWMLACCMVALGLAYLLSPGMFESPYFSTMAGIMPQKAWGTVVTSTGLMRLVMLWINGSWHVSPYFRAAGAMIAAFLWLTLFVSFATSDGLVQSVGLWLTFFAFDCCAAYDAAGDARGSLDRFHAQRIGAGHADRC